MPLHPDDHGGDHADRRDGDDRLQALLLPLGQLRRQQLQPDAGGDAQGHRGQYAEPHAAEPEGAGVATQEGCDDADDERGLQALAQPDHERGKHPSPFLQLSTDEQ